MGATGESKPVVVQPGSSASRVEQPSTPDPEVVEKAKRRKFTAEYKLRIVREAELCNPGELGALLRREGLYLSNLICWRHQIEQCQLADGLGWLHRKGAVSLFTPKGHGFDTVSNHRAAPMVTFADHASCPTGSLGRKFPIRVEKGSSEQEFPKEIGSDPSLIRMVP